MSQMWTNARMVLTAAVKMPSAPMWRGATHARVMLATLVMEKIAQQVSYIILICGALLHNNTNNY